MQRSWVQNRIIWAIAGALVLGLIGVNIATHLGAYHFSAAGSAAAGGTTGAPAQGSTVDVTGTITTINIFADTLALKTADGATHTVAVTPDTQFTGFAQLGDLNRGQRIEVTGTQGSDGTIQAATITAK